MTSMKSSIHFSRCILRNRCTHTAVSAITNPSSRLLTTSTTNAVNRLQFAVEEYRMKNFTYTLPSRCKKEIIHAADVRKDGLIPIEGVMMMIENIGASSLVTRKDMEGIFYELGEESKFSSDRESGSTGLTIAKERMLQIL